MDQARKMLNMRIKIDVFTKRLDERFREGVREDLRELFCQLPPQRVWLYLKSVQDVILGTHSAAPGDELERDQADALMGRA
jgi:hypothetical protein